MTSPSLALLMPIASLIATIVAIFVTHYLIKKREIEAGILEAKRREFWRFFDLVVYIVLPEKGVSAEERDKETLSRMIEVKKLVLIWGSGDLISAWNNFEKGLLSPSMTSSTDPLALIGLLHSIMTAFRKELGHSEELEPQDLVGIFVKDRILGTAE